MTLIVCDDIEIIHIGINYKQQLFHLQLYFTNVNKMIKLNAVWKVWKAICCSQMSRSKGNSIHITLQLESFTFQMKKQNKMWFVLPIQYYFKFLTFKWNSIIIRIKFELITDLQYFKKIRSKIAISLKTTDDTKLNLKPCLRKRLK